MKRIRTTVILLIRAAVWLPKVLSVTTPKAYDFT